MDGVQNEKGLAKSKEFLGFEGTNCEAIIDLGKEEEISIIRVYTFEQSGSWIYPPSTLNYYTSDNGIDFTKITDGSYNDIASGEKVRKLDVYFEKRKTRYVKIDIKNLGIIPDGKPGTGHKAWLFVDEIEVN